MNFQEITDHIMNNSGGWHVSVRRDVFSNMTIELTSGDDRLLFVDMRHKPLIMSHIGEETITDHGDMTSSELLEILAAGRDAPPEHQR